MTHYFDKNNDNLKSNPKEIAFRIHTVDLVFKTDHGVFSKNKLDRGTTVLLDYLEIKNTMKSALDLGCGYGVIGIYLAKRYDMRVELIDINKRAINLTQTNITKNTVDASALISDGFESITDTYDLIITNPPIRAGKKVIYPWFKKAKDHLTKTGEFWFVINKKHGANSAIKYVKEIYETVEVVGKKKGFRVIRCR
ncbi:MAG: methyltransferase [Candidatus Izimaplasma sp.]|nr:methyltransferase [Candidatus Izimaplasma bacterium]